MATGDTLQAKCSGCGFEAPASDGTWDAAEHPPLGTVVQCPECGSTDVHSQA